jgi:membrane fusion protein (multidrug efflux system)
MKNLSVLMSAVALVILSSCQTKKTEEHEATTYLVSSPLVKDTVITKDYVCQIHAIRHIELRALEKGYLQQISVDEGQMVKKGQPMFQIMPNVYEAELKKAKAEARVAQIEYKNTQLLAEAKVVSENELSLAKAHLEKANAEVLMAQTHLDFTDIRAPFSGIMDHLHVREGSLLDEGEMLTTLSDNSQMWVYFNVPESEYLDYITDPNKKSRQSVSLLMANNQVFENEGIVETIEGEFNSETGNIAFRANFKNENGILRHGETGSILMKTPFKKALIIPQKATFEVLDKRYVFVVDSSNRVSQREVQVTAELPHLFIISKGLKANERILIDGIRMVRDKDLIEVNYQAPKSIIEKLALYAE